MARARAGSSNGRTPDSGSGSLGSSPSPAACWKAPQRGLFLFSDRATIAVGADVTIRIPYSGRTGGTCGADPDGAHQSRAADRVDGGGGTDRASWNRGLDVVTLVE